MTMLAVEKGPFAATGEKYGNTPAWIPFVQVQDVDAATATATKKAHSKPKVTTSKRSR